VDVVFIMTRHDSHAELSVKAAEAGKHVLCEKPMGMNREQCRAVAEAVRKSGVKYTVGYNRGMAPLVTRAGDLLAGMTEKKLIYHRIQAPFPAHTWTHDPVQGGGRFVGEGCHIFDLLCELVRAEPVSVYAAGGVFLDPAQVTIPDSGLVTIAFADGSAGTTLIASAGCAEFPKEATEIYCGGKAIHILDFKLMQHFGFEGAGERTIELDARDKGHTAEIDQLADAIANDTEPPNGPVKASRAAVISFMAYESLARGARLPLSRSDYVF
jgi:predicted dehydrogenase